MCTYMYRSHFKLDYQRVNMSRLCSYCGKSYASRQSLSNHRKKCKQMKTVSVIPRQNVEALEKRKGLANSILDSIPEKKMKLSIQVPILTKVPKVTEITISKETEPEIEEFPELTELDLIETPKELPMNIECLKPKSFFDLSMEQSDDPDVIFLPSTIEGLTIRFNKLLYEYQNERKLQNRNELVFILDEMLRQEFIDKYDYTLLNNIIDKSGSGIEEKEEMNTQQMVQRVFDNKMKKQITELKNIIHEFGKKDGSLPIEELLVALNEYLEVIYWVDDKKVLKILDRGSFQHSNI